MQYLFKFILHLNKAGIDEVIEKFLMKQQKKPVCLSALARVTGFGVEFRILITEETDRRF